MAEGAAQANQLEELAETVRVVEEEHRDLKAREAERLGEYDASFTGLTEDQAKVARFRLKAALRLGPRLRAD
eukprot:9018656-Alexandrium_andersonii.AAC.1